MAIILTPLENFQSGLVLLLESTFSMRDNLAAKVETPVLADGKHTWGNWLDSKTMHIYGGVNSDKRHRFKIDHNFDLSTIINSLSTSDGDISISPEKYQQSQGTEFILIQKSQLNDTQADYAIRADKYASVRNELNRRTCTVAELEKAGGFKVNQHLMPEEALTSDGWIEYAVGKNNATAIDYQNARELLAKYIHEAQIKGYFNKGGGMGFFAQTDSFDGEVRAVCLYDLDLRSDARIRTKFSGLGRLLKVLAEPDDPIGPAYQTLVTHVDNLPPDVVMGLTQIAGLHLHKLPLAIVKALHDHTTNYLFAQAQRATADKQYGPCGCTSPQ